MTPQSQPQFPHFKDITLGDKADLENIIHKYLPYSDFNFTNLWSWDVLHTRKFSELNGNLVILFTDYRTSTPVLSFLGNHKALETAELLLKHTTVLKIEPSLKYVPELTAESLLDSTLHVVEDKPNHDYIFSVKEIAFPESKKLKSKRRLANTFVKNNPHVRILQQTLSDTATQQQILSVLYCWEQNKQLTNKSYEIVYEEMALRRLLSTASDHNLILTSLYEADTMIAFSIDEILPHNYAISHFIKADIRYRGIYEYLNQSVASVLLERQVHHWNWEQDLNLEGLRMLKNSYQPTHFLKKYTVSYNKP